MFSELRSASVSSEVRARLNLFADGYDVMGAFAK